MFVPFSIIITFGCVLGLFIVLFAMDEFGWSDTEMWLRDAREELYPLRDLAVSLCEYYAGREEFDSELGNRGYSIHEVAVLQQLRSIPKYDLQINMRRSAMRYEARKCEQMLAVDATYQAVQR